MKKKANRIPFPHPHGGYGAAAGTLFQYDAEVLVESADVL